MQTPWLKYYSKKIQATPLPRLNVYDYLLQSNQKNLDRPALDYFTRSISYRDFFTLIDRAAQAFHALGIKTGTHVALALLLTPESLAVFYALAKIGAITNWLDPRFTPTEFQEYLQENKNHYFITLDIFLAKLIPVLPHTNVTKVVSISPLISAPLPLKLLALIKKPPFPRPRFPANIIHLTWSKFLALAATTPPLTSVYQPNLPLTIIHTSGTTSRPKGVLLSHDNLNASIFQCFHIGPDWSSGESWFSYFPPFLAVGLVNDVHLPLVLGKKNIIIPNFDMIKLSKLLLKTRPAFVPSIALHWAEILKSPILAHADLSFLKLIMIGGDIMSPQLEFQINTFLKQHGCHVPISKCYGMSESSAVTVASYGKHNPPGSVGIPMLKTFVKIVQPETTHEVALGEKGEICIAGPIIMLGYAGNKKATAATLKIHPHDGKTWLHTGDFGHLDPDGILYLDGRLKRMIIRRGFKVFPVTIEKLLLTHPAVKECVVTGIADEQEVQVPRAHLVLQPNYDLPPHQVEQQLRSLCSEKLADYNCPKVYRFLSQIPLTSNSKTNYRALEQLP